RGVALPPRDVVRQLLLPAPARGGPPLPAPLQAAADALRHRRPPGRGAVHGNRPAGGADDGLLRAGGRHLQHRRAYRARTPTPPLGPPHRLARRFPGTTSRPPRTATGGWPAPS